MVFHAFTRMYLKAIALHSGIRLIFPSLSKLKNKCLSSARLVPCDYYACQSAATSTAFETVRKPRHKPNAIQGNQSCRGT